MLGKVTVAEGLTMLDRNSYDAFEMIDWRNQSLLPSFIEEKKKHSLACACIIANRGVAAPKCGLVNPAEREGFLQEINLAVEAAKKLDCKKLLVLTGNELGGMSREQQTSNVVAGLRAAAPILEKNGMTAIVEVLNTFVDHAGYFLYYIRDGAEIVDRVGSPNVKLLFDLYHTQIMEGNLISNLRTYIQHVGHFHVGDHPGRNEPGTGEINFRNVFKAIYELGDRYTGYVALEFRPLAPIEQVLPAMRQLTTFG
jgi:hydroxypyruvate isomerase